METKTMEGKIKAIKKPEILRTGTGKKGKWNLYSAGIMMAEKDWHNVTSFSQKELDDMISGLTEGDYVTIVDEKNQKGYWQISSIVKQTNPAAAVDDSHQEAEPTEEEIKACQDDPIERFGKIYAQCKAKIEEIYGMPVTLKDRKTGETVLAPEMIAAVNTMFIQAAREMKW